MLLKPFLPHPDPLTNSTNSTNMSFLSGLMGNKAAGSFVDQAVDQAGEFVCLITLNLCGKCLCFCIYFKTLGVVISQKMQQVIYIWPSLNLKWTKL